MRTAGGGVSGGHFGYVYYCVEDFVRQLETTLDDPGYEIGDEARTRLWLIHGFVGRAAKLMHATEWYLSCDWGDETFIAETDEIL